MIVPMKKVSLVLLDSQKKAALESLRDLGVVHLEQLEGAGEQLSLYKKQYENATVASSLISEIKTKNKKIQQQKLDTQKAIQKCQEIIDLSEEKKKLLDMNVSCNAELDKFALWGSICIEDFDFLKSKGISFRLYEIPADKYDTLGDSVKTIAVNRLQKTVRFLLLEDDNSQKDTQEIKTNDLVQEKHYDLPPEAFAVSLPSHSTDELKKIIQKNNNRIQAINDTLQKQVVYTKTLLDLKDTLDTEIEFENVFCGMECDTEGKPTDLAWLCGYVPSDCYKDLATCAKQNNWALLGTEPAEDDAVPTKLKNNPLVSLIYPLTDFLGTVPGYHEYDISGWFLLFFTVFFGMIFGDGGYGLLVTAGSFIAILVSLVKGKKVSSMLGLVFLLGLSTVAWGTVTCTWFGLTPEQLPSWLKNISVPPLSNAFSDFAWLPFWTNDISSGTLTTAQNLQIFCFTLAFLQLSVAHFKGIKRYHKSLKCIGELGSLLQLWGMYYVVLSMVVSSSIFSFALVIYGIPIGLLSIGLVAVGFLLSFVFANYDGNLLESIMASVKGIISVLLGVVNVFSDIVSYIRLWAVGLAGAAISSTVNTMAGPILGHAILFLAALVLLVFGHGLNMILNLLSVIVHGVRLNTLEFSTHLGMSWSGFKYAPFARKKVS